MRIGVIVAAACACVLAGAAQAKTLVYCSEGSPENFNPMLNTTGTTFDANAPIYSRWSISSRGTTEVGARCWPRSWDVSADGRTDHVPSAP